MLLKRPSTLDDVEEQTTGFKLEQQLHLLKHKPMMKEENKQTPDIFLDASTLTSPNSLWAGRYAKSSSISSPPPPQYVPLTSESLPPSPPAFFAADISSLGSSAADSTVVFALLYVPLVPLKVKRCAQEYLEKIFGYLRSYTVIKEASDTVYALLEEHKPVLSVTSALQQSRMVLREKKNIVKQLVMRTETEISSSSPELLSSVLSLLHTKSIEIIKAILGFVEVLVSRTCRVNCITSYMKLSSGHLYQDIILNQR
ncbi:hypothetical protein Bca4012_055239 [Brassica carinata]